MDYAKADIETLDNVTLLSLARQLSLPVNSLIWDSLVSAGLFEGNPDSTIPDEYKYKRTAIINMVEDTSKFLDHFGLWPQIRRMVIQKLIENGQIEPPPVSLTIPTETTVPGKSAYGWIDDISDPEVRTEIVTLLNVLSANKPITMDNIQNLLLTYDYDRLIKICNVINPIVTSSTRRGRYLRKRIPEITLSKLQQINSILCTSEHFWRLIYERDFGVIEKPEDISWRTQYTITSILRSEDYAEDKWWEISERKDLSIGVLEATMNDPRFKWDWFYLLHESNLRPSEVAYFWFTHNPEKVKKYEFPPWFKMPIGGMTGNPDNPGHPGYGYEWWIEHRPKTSKLQELVDVYKISTLRTTRNRPVYTPAELRKILKELGLSTKGNKEVLVYRLVDAIAEDPVLEGDMRYFKIHKHLYYERAGISRYTDGRWK